MNRLMHGVAAAAVACAAAVAVASPASADPLCSTQYSYYGGQMTCGNVRPNQGWQIIAACSVPYGSGEESTPGTVVYGNGTSSAVCDEGPIVGSSISFIVPGGPVGQIVSVYAGRCVDLSQNDPAPGQAIQLWDCNGTSAQAWLIGTDGTLRVRGGCMGLAGRGTGNLTLAEWQDCDGSDSQQWTPRTDGSLFNPYSGRCLDDLGYNVNAGARLGIWDCSGATNQRWTVPA